MEADNILELCQNQISQVLFGGKDTLSSSITFAFCLAIKYASEEPADPLPIKITSYDSDELLEIIHQIINILVNCSRLNPCILNYNFNFGIIA